jgi:hypothetical protein
MSEGRILRRHRPRRRTIQRFVRTAAPLLSLAPQSGERVAARFARPGEGPLCGAASPLSWPGSSPLSWPGKAVRRTAFFQNAYVPAISIRRARLSALSLSPQSGERVAARFARPGERHPLFRGAAPKRVGAKVGKPGIQTAARPCRLSPLPVKRGEGGRGSRRAIASGREKRISLRLH